MSRAVETLKQENQARLNILGSGLVVVYGQALSSRQSDVREPREGR
jgi:hypothetical protein